MSTIAELEPLWLLVGLLAAAVAVAIVVHRSDVPASVVLVLLGLGLAIIGPGASIRISPDLLLAIVLPGLVFEAAFRTELAVVRRAAIGVILLAVPGVVVVATIVALLLAATTQLSIGEAFVVGAMVAATDPAAVLSTFRRIAVPARLATTVEMESLVNDGTGIVLFGLALGLLTGGASVAGSIAAFAGTIAGGALLGAALGWAAGHLVGRVQDHVIELTITIVLAYGTYLIATALGVSGVIATLVAAGAFGANSRPALTERAAETIDVVWELVAFLLTAFVFLLVGVSISPASLVHAAAPIGWGIAAILAARAVVVYGLLGISSRLLGRLRRVPTRGQGDEHGALAFTPLPLAWLHVLFWAGLRGAVSVALALSLPAGLPNRDLLQGITFGIVLFTLLVQGSTASWVVRRSGAGGT